MINLFVHPPSNRGEIGGFSYVIDMFLVYRAKLLTTTELRHRRNHPLFSRDKLTTLSPRCFDSVVSLSNKKVDDYDVKKDIYFILFYILNVFKECKGGGRELVASASGWWPEYSEFQRVGKWFSAHVLEFYHNSILIHLFYHRKFLTEWIGVVLYCISLPLNMVLVSCGSYYKSLINNRKGGTCGKFNK